MKRTLMLICCAATLVPTALLGDVKFNVTVDTTPLAGQTGSLAFDFLQGSPPGNLATISNFATTGILGASSSSGDVTGSFASPPVVLSTVTQFFNEYAQGITFGSGITTFQLDLTTNFVPGSSPDGFSFFLLDDTNAPFATDDPTGADSFIAINITDTPTPDVFTSDFGTVTVTPVVSGVPEPYSVALFATVLAALTWRRGFRRAR